MVLFSRNREKELLQVYWIHIPILYYNLKEGLHNNLISNAWLHGFKLFT